LLVNVHSTSGNNFSKSATDVDSIAFKGR